MKKYYNETTNEWYFEGNSITKLVDGVVFSGIPTVEQLESWGYEEWVEPTPTPYQLLVQAKEEKISELMNYDSSTEVNSFTINGQEMWLTRDDRTQIDESINAYEAQGASAMTKYFDGVAYTFELTTWKQMLNALIVYASEALNVTEGHKAAINTLTDIQDVENYDYTVGYPNKLEF